jgi:hypothetical protein
LAHAFLWQDSDKRLKLAQHLGQLGVFLTWAAHGAMTEPTRAEKEPSPMPPCLWGRKIKRVAYYFYRSLLWVQQKGCKR